MKSKHTSEGISKNKKTDISQNPEVIHKSISFTNVKKINRAHSVKEI